MYLALIDKVVGTKLVVLFENSHKRVTLAEEPGQQGEVGGRELHVVVGVAVLGYPQLHLQQPPAFEVLCDDHALV